MNKYIPRHINSENKIVGEIFVDDDLNFYIYTSDDNFKKVGEVDLSEIDPHLLNMVSDSVPDNRTITWYDENLHSFIPDEDGQLLKYDELDNEPYNIKLTTNNDPSQVGDSTRIILYKDDDSDIQFDPSTITDKYLKFNRYGKRTYKVEYGESYGGSNNEYLLIVKVLSNEGIFGSDTEIKSNIYIVSNEESRVEGALIRLRSSDNGINTFKTIYPISKIENVIKYNSDGTITKLSDKISEMDNKILELEQAYETLYGKIISQIVNGGTDSGDSDPNPSVGTADPNYKGFVFFGRSIDYTLPEVYNMDLDIINHHEGIIETYSDLITEGRYMGVSMNFDTRGVSYGTTNHKNIVYEDIYLFDYSNKTLDISNLGINGFISSDFNTYDIASVAVSNLINGYIKFTAIDKLGKLDYHNMTLSKTLKMLPEHSGVRYSSTGNSEKGFFVSGKNIDCLEYSNEIIYRLNDYLDIYADTETSPLIIGEEYSAFIFSKGNISRLNQVDNTMDIDFMSSVRNIDIYNYEFYTTLNGMTSGLICGGKELNPPMTIFNYSNRTIGVMAGQLSMQNMKNSTSLENCGVY